VVALQGSGLGDDGGQTYPGGQRVIFEAPSGQYEEDSQGIVALRPAVGAYDPAVALRQSKMPLAPGEGRYVPAGQRVKLLYIVPSGQNRPSGHWYLISSPTAQS